MIVYPDTSFLCSIYRQQEHTPAAVAYRDSMTEPLPYTSVLEFEFLQATRLQVWLHSHDRTKGYPQRVADEMIADWESDVAQGLNVIHPTDADLVMRVAHDLSRRFTSHGGHRTLDLLHVATAVHLGADTFLTFDARQEKLAKALGLRIPRWKKQPPQKAS